MRSITSFLEKTCNAIWFEWWSWVSWARPVHNLKTYVLGRSQTKETFFKKKRNWRGFLQFLWNLVSDVHTRHLSFSQKMQQKKHKKTVGDVLLNSFWGKDGVFWYSRDTLLLTLSCQGEQPRVTLTISRICERIAWGRYCLGVCCGIAWWGMEQCTRKPCLRRPIMIDVKHS